MTIELRAATGDDVDAIAEIEALVFSDPWSAASFAGLLGGQRSNLTVATDGAKVVGYAVLLLAPPDADLANLAVTPSVRGKGIGRKLLDHTIEMARATGITHMYLEVRASNARAIGMYERSGFREFGMRRRYYRDPVEDAKVLRLELKND